MKLATGRQIYARDGEDLVLRHVTSTPEALRKFWRSVRPHLSAQFTDSANIKTIFANLATDHTIK